MSSPVIDLPSDPKELSCPAVSGVWGSEYAAYTPVESESGFVPGEKREKYRVVGEEGEIL